MRAKFDLCPTSPDFAVSGVPSRYIDLTKTVLKVRGTELQVVEIACSKVRTTLFWSTVFRL